jgi:hypothetical protein
MMHGSAKAFSSKPFDATNHVGQLKLQALAMVKLGVAKKQGVQNELLQLRTYVRM